ncbi:hypothetical protein DACRYDRAFT_29117, partial [Dacryopinax primogenitus]
VLAKHHRAFALDGRLSHYPEQLKIKLQDGARPVCSPMYGAFLLKWKVIDKQLEKWFKLGVIEASVSPWASPVVIVYHNNKACF